MKKEPIKSDIMSKKEIKDARTKKTTKMNQCSIKTLESIQKPTKEEALNILERARRVIEETKSHLILVMAKEGKSQISGSTTISNLSTYEIAILTISAFRVDIQDPKNSILITLLAEAIADVK